MKRVLVLIDFTDLAPAVLKAGGEISRALNARLHLVHAAVREEPLEDENIRGSTTRHEAARNVRHHRQALDILELELKKQGTDVDCKIIRGTSSRGKPARTLIEEIARLNPDVIVMGTRQRSKLRRFFLGSISDVVVHHARCPVVLVPRGEPQLTAYAPGGSGDA